jgi:branched-chain amino acid transport system ATP-binding protein
MLELRDLNAWYGRSHVLQGISLQVGEGEAVCIIGRNGAGKTTTLRTVMGLVPKRAGHVQFRGTDILNEPTHRRLSLGLAYVPEERRIVPGLTVQENLRLGLVASENRKRESEVIDRITETFPLLRERLTQSADTLSGGEQQMLAIARAMAAEPRMVMLDEPSEGIMPILVDEMFELFGRLKQQGTTILIVEQNVERALQLADRAYVMDQGEIVHSGNAKDLLVDKEIQERYCAI